MCFTDAKKKEILNANGATKKKDILKIVAVEWKKLSDRDRAFWDEEARNDKVRYVLHSILHPGSTACILTPPILCFHRFVREKADYKGPWKITKRRAKKHPLAPKRPMSAFLKYSQTKRSQVKVDNANIANTDVSRLLGEMWRTASPTEKKPFVEEELVERAKYKEEIKKFREGQAKHDAASRTSHRSVQQVAAAEKPHKKQKEPPRSHHGGRMYLDPAHSVPFPPQQYRPSPTASISHVASSSYGSGDRRVFRPYSGSHPYESARYYKVEHQMVHPSYDHNEVIPPPPPPPIKVEPMYISPKPSPTESRPYGAAPGNARVEGNNEQLGLLPQPFRNSFQLPESHYASIRPSSSDISQFEGFNIDGNLNESFPEHAPPFNPHQKVCAIIVAEPGK